MENPLNWMISNEDEVTTNEKQRICCTKADEYRMISDLTGFENLRDTIEAETFRKRKRRRRKKRNKMNASRVHNEAAVCISGVGETINHMLEVNMIKETEVPSTVEGLETISMETKLIHMEERKEYEELGKKECPKKTPSMGRELVHMEDSIVLRMLLRKPRYFDPPGDNGNTWQNYGEVDQVRNCTTQRRKKPCFICGSLEHRQKHCKQVCFVCSRKGHLGTDCRKKFVEDTPAFYICLVCGDSGHSMFSCTRDNSPDDLKDIQCYVCKRFGHLCCADFPVMDLGEPSCYNCGQLGHMGSECKKLHRGRSALKAPGSDHKCGKEVILCKNA
ncbi:Zinc finger, CCHC-type [Quillaja saponaria]|uniref:Zinc finger, CCHC-type n=1 Tax=Quillaja saponaria TaxID=32244 RepID=A0AAD7VF69_QUISA|nr:Zinc finger, CCHC-type [Quillaja saponaria]